MNQLGVLIASFDRHASHYGLDRAGRVMEGYGGGGGGGWVAGEC